MVDELVGLLADMNLAHVFYPWHLKKPGTFMYVAWLSWTPMKLSYE